MTNARIWTPAGVQRPGELHIEGGRISRIGRAPRPAGARHIDAADAILLPGLFDAHVHLDALPAPNPTNALTRKDIIAIASRQTLASGVTSARMHLSDVETGPPLGRQSNHPCYPAPRLALGGPGLTGGAPQLASRLMRGVTGPDDGRAKVRSLHTQGFAWLALHDVARFSDEELDAITSEAQRGGLRIMAAADEFADLRVALRIPVDTLEYLNRSTASSYPSDVLDTLRAHRDRLFITPPVGYYTRYQHYRAAPPRVRDPLHTRFYPDGIASELLDALETQFREGQPNPIEASFQTLGPKLQQLWNTGVPLLLGSDSGSPGQFHIDAIWHEMRALRDLGLGLSEIVTAATVNGGRLLRDPQVGRLSVGDRADLVIYRGDFFGGELDVRRVDTVIKEGVVYVKDGQWVGPARN